MKTQIKFRFVAMVSLLMAAVLFTDKLTAQTFHVKPPSKPFTESAIYQLASNTFSFDILVSHCFAGGTSVFVSIANPEKYAYLWEVNGNHGGHQIKVDCVSGTYAKVRVMRLSDGLSISRTVKLPMGVEDSE